MFAFVKKLLGKKTDSGPVESKSSSAASAAPEKAASSSAAVSAVQGGTSRLTRAEVSARTPAPPPQTPPVDPSASLKLSLLGIVDLLPKELKPTKAVGDIASVQIAVPLSLVAGQLSSGCVRISFGELKQFAPQGFFTIAGSDDKQIDLPLQEILPQVTASLFTRREGQQAVYVPEDVTNVFSARGGTLAPTNKPSACSASMPSSQPQAAVPSTAKPAAGPANPVAQAGSPGRPNPASGSTTMYFKRPGAGANPSAKTADPAKPASPAVGNTAPATAKSAATPASQPSRPAGAPGTAAPVKPAAVTPPATPAPAAEPAPPVSKPIAAPNLLAALKPGAPVTAAPSGGKQTKPADPIPGPAPIPVSARSSSVAPGKPAAAPAVQPSAPASAATASDERRVSIPLSKLSPTWPESIQVEIATWQIGGASLSLPVSQVEAALRQGRVSYSWSSILEQLEQGAGGGKESAAGDTVLDLSLSVVAPAFLAARQNAPARASSSIDATIPDLFQSAKPSEAVPAAPTPAAAPAAAPAKPAPKASAPAAGKPAHGLTMKSPAAAPAVPAVAPSAPAADPHAGEFLSIPVAMVDDSWLEPIKAELAKTKMPGLKIQIPYEEVNRGLKSGKLEYPWKQVRAWIQPALASNLAGDHSEKPVTLPLKVVAPMFLGHFKPGKAGKKADISQDIPDLFSGGSSAPAEIATTTATPETTASPAASTEASGNAEAAPASGSGSYSTTQFFRKPPTDIGELFGQPGKRHWSPQEIVQGTTRIRGVAGAVIAMQDGLLVAAQLQNPWRPEATAAFLPQIYSRLNQYLNELNAGGLRSVTLDTPSGRLLVFSSGIIYFAVVTKPDETVPIAAIELIVGELGRHSK